MSSGPHMTVVFVADEGVADSGFNATYQAVSVLDSELKLKLKLKLVLGVASDQCGAVPMSHPPCPLPPPHRDLCSQPLHLQLR